MYCSTCGEIVIQGLNYCKNCGARVNGAKEDEADKLSESSFNLLVAAVMAIPIAGLGIIIGLMSVMKNQLGFNNELIVIFVAAAFLLLLTSETALIWLLVQSAKIVGKTDDASRSKDSAQLPGAAIKGLNAAKTRQLVEPVPTVIENTTRSLETVARERKT
ncbi:MAG TPA: hypothetical protein VGB00_00640, partial [Pyrinomonadaceae bacterium]